MISWIYGEEEEDRQWNEFVLGCFENSVDGDLALWRSHKSGRVQLSMIDRTQEGRKSEIILQPLPWGKREATATKEEKAVTFWMDVTLQIYSFSDI